MKAMKTPQPLKVMVLAASLFLGMLGGGCSRTGQNSETPDTGGTNAGNPPTARDGGSAGNAGADFRPPAVPSAVVVNVTLKEWTITADKTAVPAGPVQFVVANHGTVVHEMVVVKTESPASALRVENGTVDEAAAGQVIGEVEEFSPGWATRSAAFNLQPGSYVFLCNVIGHYGHGMRLAFTVH
jgi:uncharacterized cupredoxin-like copper-binding protein